MALISMEGRHASFTNGLGFGVLPPNPPSLGGFRVHIQLAIAGFLTNVMGRTCMLTSVTTRLHV